MGWIVKYCDACKKLYSGQADKCSKCGAALKSSKYDFDEYCTYSIAQKEAVAKELFGDSDNVTVEANEDVKTETSSKSSVGSAIKVISVIVIVLSVLGSLLMISSAGFAVGGAALILSLLVGLLSFGIGEICDLLTNINDKLDKIK